MSLNWWVASGPPEGSDPLADPLGDHGRNATVPGIIMGPVDGIAMSSEDHEIRIKSGDFLFHDDSKECSMDPKHIVEPMDTRNDC